MKLANVAQALESDMRRYRHGYAETIMINFKPMKRDGACMLVEFSHYESFLEAWDRLLTAFPERKFLTGVGDRSAYQIVLNTEDEITFLKLIENDLLK